MEAMAEMAERDGRDGGNGKKFPLSKAERSLGIMMVRKPNQKVRESKK